MFSLQHLLQTTLNLVKMKVGAAEAHLYSRFLYLTYMLPVSLHYLLQMTKMMIPSKLERGMENNMEHGTSSYYFMTLLGHCLLTCHKRLKRPVQCSSLIRGIFGKELVLFVAWFCCLIYLRLHLGTQTRSTPYGYYPSQCQ
jgi:hypothetical protein